MCKYTHLSNTALQHLQARLRLQEVLLCNWFNQPINNKPKFKDAPSSAGFINLC